MSANEQIRSMLDQLMGTSRNGKEDRPLIKFHDAQVCKAYLYGACPRELLANTRMNVGECPKVHNAALRADFENYIKDKSCDNQYFCDLDALIQLRTFISEAERIKRLTKKNLEDTQHKLSIKADEILELERQIQDNLIKAERLGSNGFVEKSLKVIELNKELEEKKEKAKQDLRGPYPSTMSQVQTFSICPVCLAHISVNDPNEKLAGHFGGKLHLGFMKIKETLANLEESVGHKRAREPERDRYRDRDRDRDWRRIKRNFKKGYKDIGRRRWHSSRFRTKDSSVSESSSDDD